MRLVFPWMRPCRMRRMVVAGFGCALECLELSCLLPAPGMPQPNDRDLDERQRRVTASATTRLAWREPDLPARQDAN